MHSPAKTGRGMSAESGALAGETGSNANNKRRKTATGTTSRAAGPSSSYRTADRSGSAPSDQMKPLMEAEESTRAAGEAGYSGRRPRVPSRKLLEATGKVLDEGAQWMTKEKREEQCRRNRELTEQKKAAAAAGLRVGQVLETSAFPSPRGTVGRGALGSGDEAVSKFSWRKLTPAETLRIAGKQAAIDGARLDLPIDNAQASDKTGVVAESKGQQEGRASISAAAAAESDRMFEKEQERVAAADDPAAQQGPTIVEMAHESRPKRGRKNDAKRPCVGGEKRAAKATCEFDSCSKKASFGVNGVVRYW